MQLPKGDSSFSLSCSEKDPQPHQRGFVSLQISDRKSVHHTTEMILWSMILTERHQRINICKCWREFLHWAYAGSLWSATPQATLKRCQSNIEFPPFHIWVLGPEARSFLQRLEKLCWGIAAFMGVTVSGAICWAKGFYLAHPPWKRETKVETSPLHQLVPGPSRFWFFGTNVTQKWIFDFLCRVWVVPPVWDIVHFLLVNIEKKLKGNGCLYE